MSSKERNILLVGRWHGVTIDQESALRRALFELDPGSQSKLIFVITASDKGGTKRHPLMFKERVEVVTGLALALGHPYEIHGATDTKTTDIDWVKHVEEVVRSQSNTKTVLSPNDTILLSSNDDVLARFKKAGYSSKVHASKGKTPADIISLVTTGKDWRAITSPWCVEVYDRLALGDRIVELFKDVLVNDDGELSNGRDFKIYALGMDASMADKVRDIGPHIRPGRIVDKGCGTGSLLTHLSELFGDSQIIGMDLSSEMRRMSEGLHYHNHNVAIVAGNIIEQRFPQGSLSTVIYSSVMHEIYSYNGYDRDQVRLALANTRKELARGGRLIIRDGIKPDNFEAKTWMRADDETKERFYRFAHDFKGKSTAPGIAFEERVIGGVTWLCLSLHDANEFLSKKDYLANWAIECNEEFGVFTKAQWIGELEAAGYRVVQCTSYMNPWILKNRYQNRAWLHTDNDGAPGDEISFPDTTAVIVAEAL